MNSHWSLKCGAAWEEIVKAWWDNVELTFPGEQTCYYLLKGRAWFSFMWKLLCIALVVKRSHNLNKNEDLSSHNRFIYVNNCNRFSTSQELPSCNIQLWSLGVTKQLLLTPSVKKSWARPPKPSPMAVLKMWFGSVHLIFWRGLVWVHFMYLLPF